MDCLLVRHQVCVTFTLMDLLLTIINTGNVIHCSAAASATSSLSAAAECLLTPVC